MQNQTHLCMFQIPEVVDDEDEGGDNATTPSSSAEAPQSVEKRPEGPGGECIIF